MKSKHAKEHSTANKVGGLEIIVDKPFFVYKFNFFCQDKAWNNTRASFSECFEHL